MNLTAWRGVWREVRGVKCEHFVRGCWVSHISVKR